MEMKLPKAPLPQFSSLNKAYKRSSSAGLKDGGPSRDRTRSLERDANDGGVYGGDVHPPVAEEPTLEEASMEDKKSMRASDSSASTQTKIPSLVYSPTPPGGSLKQRGISNRLSKKRLQKPIDDETSLQRQNTHTLMTAQQNREAGIRAVEMAIPKKAESEPRATEPVAQCPGPIPVAAKPRSVVKPMPKTEPKQAPTPAAAHLNTCPRPEKATKNSVTASTKASSLKQNGVRTPQSARPATTSAIPVQAPARLKTTTHSAVVSSRRPTERKGVPRR